MRKPSLFQSRTRLLRNVYFAAFAAALPLAAAATTIAEFPVSQPALGITQGPDHNLWFTAGGGSVVGRITPAGVVTEYPQTSGGLGNGSDLFAGILTGADGTLWFSDPVQNAVGRITFTGHASLFPVTGTTTLPGDIVLGPDGNYWFTEQFTKSIGRITPDGAVTHFPIAGQPGGVGVLGDGNIWFTENELSGCGIDFCSTSDAHVGVMTTSGQVKAEYQVFGINPIAGRMARGPDGNLWFTVVYLTGPEFMTSGGRLGFATRDGHVDTVALPTPNSGPAGITTGPDGALWFTESAANQIGRRGADGNFNEYALPTPDAAPNGIVGGPDGNLWFTETKAHAIGRLTPGTPAPFSIGGYLSGNWFNSQQPGQGFEIEVTTQGQMLVIWFTYTPDGKGQNWIYAQGPYDKSKNSVTLPAQLLSGARFPPNFVPGDVHGTAWGTLTLQFSDCDNGFVSWDSKLPGYDQSNGRTLTLSRVTQIDGTACPAQ